MGRRVDPVDEPGFATDGRGDAERKVLGELEGLEMVEGDALVEPFGEPARSGRVGEQPKAGMPIAESALGVERRLQRQGQPDVGEASAAGLLERRHGAAAAGSRAVGQGRHGPAW